jgi:hypothetical protein
MEVMASEIEMEQDILDYSPNPLEGRLIWTIPLPYTQGTLVGARRRYHVGAYPLEEDMVKNLGEST